MIKRESTIFHSHLLSMVYYVCNGIGNIQRRILAITYSAVGYKAHFFLPLITNSMRSPML